MDVVEYHYNQHLGLLLIYELPDTVKQKVTEAEAYSTVWDIQMKLQHALPRSVVYYGQDTLKDGGTRYGELGVFRVPVDIANVVSRARGIPRFEQLKNMSMLVVGLMKQLTSRFLVDGLVITFDEAAFELGNHVA